MTENYLQIAEGQDLTAAELVKTAQHAVRAAFIPAARKAEILDAIAEAGSLAKPEAKPSEK